MQLLVQLNELDNAKKFQEKNVAVAIGLEHYSHAILQCTPSQIGSTEGKVFVLVNRLYDQKEIAGLRKSLQQLANTNIYGIIFQDFAVLSICSQLEMKCKLYYNSDTLNTNHATMNTLGKLGVNGCMIASQLHESEVKEILKKTEVETILPVHGLQYISQSKRKLLTNYFAFHNQTHDTSYQARLTMKVNGQDTYSHIFEDDYGTIVYTTNELCLKDFINELKADYYYIETFYLDTNYILDLIDFYQSDLSYMDLVEKYPTHHYDTGFLEDGTVYKLEDVRKRENNEKR